MTEQPLGDAANAVAASARDLIKVYGKGEAEVRALDGVTVDLMKGEFTAIMGPSGSGKSTLMHCLAALDTPTSGEAVVDGTSLGKLKDKDLTTLRRERVGFVFQSFNLFAHKTVLQNVTLGPVKVLGVGKDEAEKRGRELLDRVGIASQADKYPAQLSGGQQQRVAIARALANVILLECPPPTPVVLAAPIRPPVRQFRVPSPAFPSTN